MHCAVWAQGFVAEVCNEKWMVENGMVTVVQTAKEGKLARNDSRSAPPPPTHTHTHSRSAPTRRHACTTCTRAHRHTHTHSTNPTSSWRWAGWLAGWLAAAAAAAAGRRCRARARRIRWPTRTRRGGTRMGRRPDSEAAVPLGRGPGGGGRDAVAGGSMTCSPRWDDEWDVICDGRGPLDGRGAREGLEGGGGLVQRNPSRPCRRSSGGGLRCGGRFPGHAPRACQREMMRRRL